MKAILIYTILILTFFGIQAQTEEVPSLIIVEHDFDWYKKQFEAWSAELAKDSTNEQAWDNYRRAARYCGMKGGGVEYTKKADVCIELVQRHIPNTFTAYRLQAGQMGVWQPARIDLLKKAEALNPNDPLLLEDLIVHELVFGTDVKVKEYATRFYNTNHFSPGYYHYNYNVLVGLPQNAVLFTCGDLDSYPVWTLQQVHAIRTDVTLINVHLLNLHEYREMVFKRIGVPMNAELDTLIEQSYNHDDKSEVEKLALKHIQKHSKSKIHIGLTYSGSKMVADLSTKLYLCGLSYEYSEKPIENIPLLNDAFKKMKLDYLEVYFLNDRCQAWNKVFSINYLLPMITLYEKKKAGEEKDKLRRLILKIAADTGKEADVKKKLGI